MCRVRPGVWWAGAQLYPLASHSDPSGRGPVRSAWGCLCPQVTEADPGGCCGLSEWRVGLQRSLAAASPPADWPAAGSHSQPPPNDVFWRQHGCDARLAVLSLPSWGFVLSWERGVHCLCWPGVCFRVSRDFSGPTVGRADPAAQDLPVCCAHSGSSCLHFPRLLFPFSTSISTHSSQLFPPDLFREDSSAKPRKSLFSRFLPLLDFSPWKWGVCVCVCVCVHAHARGEREKMRDSF